MRLFLFVAAACLALTSAHAQGWQYFRLHVLPTHKCGFAREVAASYYEQRQGSETSSGEGYDRRAFAAASPKKDGWRRGAVLRLKNPRNGRTATIRINDTLPMGEAYRSGVRLDLTPAVHRTLGLSATNWVCVSQ